MNDFHLGLLAAPLVGALTSLLLLPLLLFSGRLPQDRPNERSLHSSPTPRSGGIAIMVPVLLCGWTVAPELHLTLSCAGALAFVSLIDDLRPLPAIIRLLFHLIAASGLVLGGFPATPGIGAFCMVVALVWMTNLYNFMDGSDGLAGGMAVIGFSCYAGIAWQTGLNDFAQICTAIAACSAVFLIFNFHPARIFMGDIGSIPLGFLAAAFGLRGWSLGLWPWWLPLLVFSPFIVDASLTLIRRTLRGERVWQAHRNHYYQRVIRMGMGHRGTALWGYLLMILAATNAVVMVHWPWPVQIALLTAWTVVYAVLAICVDRRWRHFQENA